MANRTNGSAELLGCSMDFFLKHLESQFKLDMNWDNYGSYWSIDHIRPCASFDLTDLEQQKICFHWSNMRPLWHADHAAKTSEDIRTIASIRAKQSVAPNPTL